jgi:ankyrin repeat protein
MSSQGSQEFVLVEDDDLADYNEAGILPQPAKIQTEIQKWLQPTDYNAESSEYNKHLTSYVLGTDLWIQETEAYKQWHDSPDHGSLWVKAIAGAGKSVFAAMIASKLAETEKVPVLPFFFRQIIATNHDPHSMTRDWISMILKHSPLLQARMKKYMDDRRALENITANEFWHDLVHALVSLPKVYCVVDALDEMDIDQEAFFKNLVDLGKRKPSTVKILMTSRPLPRIEAYLKDPSVLQVRLEQRKVDEDIALYVQYRLTKTPQLNDDVRRSVKAAIGRKAQGSFLYARLMLDEFDHRLKEMLPEDRFIERSLSWLPATLEDMYNGMLLDHSLRSGVSQDLQLTILRWVTHSTRPLRLLELAAMLDSQNGRGKDTKAVVRTACGPLLEILEDETVSVIHHSFTEFLIDQDRRTRAVVDGAHPQFPVIDSIATHSSMSHTCLNYLTSGRLNDWEIKARTQDEAFYRPPASTQKNLKMKHPFLDYAMNNWYIHAGRLVPINSILLAELDGFMKVGNPSFTAWVDLVWIVSTTISKVTPLHVASWAGMASYVQHLLTLTIESNSPDPQERTPLSWASAKGHVEVVRLLLEKVSDPDVDDYFGLKPLHYAAQGNHHKIVKLLLEAGVSPLTGKTRDPGRFCGNSPSSIGHSPLMYACEAGCTETVREMTPYLKPKDLDDALCWAARSGKSHVVDILLSSPGISLDSRGDTPLFLASGGLHYEAMRSLLKKGANPNKRSMNFADQTGMLCLALDNIKATQPLGPTPLHAVCGVVRNNHTRQRDDENMKKCFKLLLDTGCDVNTVDQDGKTPLHCSIAENQWGLAQLLLENGADPMNRDKSGNTPLHLVLPSKSSVHVVELLLAKGANLNDRRPSDGCTPLHTMLGSIHGFKIEVLLPHVSDWNIEDDQGNTPLHHVLSQSHNPKPVVLELLKAGADLNRRNKNGETPIHVIKDSAGFRPVNDILPLLLAAGASLEAKDNDGRSLLLRVLNRQLWNAQKDVQYLLDIGADINTCDNEGNSVLHTVCMKGPGEVLVSLYLQKCIVHANPIYLDQNPSDCWRQSSCNKSRRKHHSP